MRLKVQSGNTASSNPSYNGLNESVDRGPSYSGMTNSGGSSMSSSTTGAYTSFQSSGGAGRGMNFVVASTASSLGAEADGRSKDGKPKTSFKDWKRRVGEKAIQKFGLGAPSNDANTGDIEEPLQSFSQMRDGLKQIQTEIRQYVMATEGLFGAAHNMRFLFAPQSGETARQLKLSLCRVAVQDAMIRGLTEYLEAPLKAVLGFCDNIDALAKQRNVLLLDYDHHKRKHEAVAARRDAGKGDMEDEARVRSVKLNHSIDQLKDCTTQVLAQVAALAKVEPQIKESLFKGLAACQVFYCQAAAMAEVRGEAEPGEVFGRPLSDFEEPPPVLLECMGFLDAQGLYVPGLFRVPGDTEQIRELKALFDSGEHVEFDEKVHNVHEVATLLKMFFRELPDPVVPVTHYAVMLDAGIRGQQEFLEISRRCISEFPATNATCLRLLFAFLFRVSLCAEDNKMNTENLGIIFAPNLLRSPNVTEISVIDLQSCINLVRRMIESATDIFPDLWQGYPAASGSG